MLRSVLAGAALAILLAPAGAVGQRLAPVPQSTLNAVRWPAASTASTQLFPAPGTPPRTYWLEGGLVGAIGLGLFSAVALRSVSDVCSRITVTTGGPVPCGW